jgi:hypothetical protein
LRDLLQVQPLPVFGPHGQDNVHFRSLVAIRHQLLDGGNGVEFNGIAAGWYGRFGDGLTMRVIALTAFDKEDRFHVWVALLAGPCWRR